MRTRNRIARLENRAAREGESGHTQIVVVFDGDAMPNQPGIVVDLRKLMSNQRDPKPGART